MTDDFQGDLFGDKFHEKKGKKPYLLEKYYKQRVLPNIRIPIEYIVISVIAILVLMIISYAVGVEKGKRVSEAKAVKTLKAVPVAVEREQAANITRSDITDLPKTEEKPKKEAPLPEKVEKPAEKKVEKEIAVPAGSAYIIQLASFKNERFAKEEINKLKKKGFEAHSARKGKWYQVYAAGYRTVHEAKKARKELYADYKDCYIRKVR